MAKKITKPKPKGPFGLSPLTLIAAACLLVIIGMSGGVILDIMMNPPQPTQRPQVSHNVPPPVIRTPDDADTAGSRVPSVLAPRPTSTSVSPPVASAEPEEPTPPVIPVVPPPPEKPIVGAPPTPESVAKAEPPAPPAKESVKEKLPKDKQPMTAYAMPSSTDASAPAIAIVIDDMGLDRVHTTQVLDLPAGITVSIMTYANDAGGLAAKARAGGHEVLAHVPMQPLSDKENPGPGTLTVDMDIDAIRATVAADLDKWDGYVGINNHMGSRFTTDRIRMGAVMAELKSRGLLWLDSRTTNGSVGVAAAEAVGVPYVTRDVFLDNDPKLDAVMKELEHAIALAKSHGTAIAIGHPHEDTIAGLKRILPTLADRGIALVPITEILKRQQARTRPS